MEIRISVRSLVEFILRSGNIDNRRASAPDHAMQEGSRIHRMIQRRMGPEYQAEVALRYAYNAGEYEIFVEGRADGIITEVTAMKAEPALTGELPLLFAEAALYLQTETQPGQAAQIVQEARSGQEIQAGEERPSELEVQNAQQMELPQQTHTVPAVPDEQADTIQQTQKMTVTIDEIKGTFQDLKKMKGPVPVHLAQARCYAYIYAEQKNLPEIRVRMTYCHMETEEIRYFHFDYTFAELQEWFLGVMEQYRKWADYSFQWQKVRQASIKALQFPYAYREGQKELATYVYQTIYHKRKLFIEAPTGVGKTISTVFPAIKAMGEGMCEKIFYLTAKTITRTVADNTFTLLREHGLRCKSVVLTAKDKICFMEETECNPEYCPYAKGHYDRINEAMYDLLTHEDVYNREKIEAFAKKHKVCPFEMCLDMSLFSDAVICDYNYVFDPHVYLRRFFAEGTRGEYIFLIDEAHNLVERGRSMYSATLCKEDFLALKRTVKAYDERIAGNLDKCNKELLILKRECETYRIEEFIDPFVRSLTRLGRRSRIIWRITRTVRCAAMC